MNQRTIPTHITHHTTIISTSLLLLIYTPLIAAPRTIKHCRSQDQSSVAAHKHHRDETTTEQSPMQLLLTDAPEDFRYTHAAKLLHAIDLFHAVPGFCATLKKVVKQAHQAPFAHGYLYEIETALFLQEEQNDPVCYFGREHSAQEPYHTHEIDVETQRYYVECKDIFWQSQRLSLNSEKLKRQLMEQSALIKEENRKTNSSKTFLLCSKQPIPTTWRTWLETQNIDYDCPDDTSDSDSGNQ